MIREDIKRRSREALKARDKDTRQALANVLSRFLEMEKSSDFKGWDDKTELKVVESYVKGLKKSIKLMEGTELAVKYESEIALLADYLPKTMSAEEAQPILESFVEKSGGRMGPFMGMVMKGYKGKIDPNVAKAFAISQGLK